jgi:NADH-quinone oxidoreductase subunit M
MMFIAFAIKMPIWPVHTWQPDTYEQSPTAVTMILSGVMVKMGVLGMVRWLMPVLHISFYQWGDTITTLAVTGMLYASLIAIQQDDLKRLVAYSSIAHIGLMCASLFAETQSGMQGVMIQMFNHGINIIGLWIVIELIERQFGTRKISQLGGLASYKWIHRGISYVQRHFCLRCNKILYRVHCIGWYHHHTGSCLYTEYDPQSFLW